MRGGILLEVGSSLGPYELLVPIARGGMAQVWAARMKGRNGFQKIVALKSMHAYLSQDPRFEQMFLSEAEFASRIQHPNVCSIHDLGEEQSRLYIAMEWVDGDTLVWFEAAHPAGLPIAIAARIGADVALGLHAVHELRNDRGEPLGLVHCDVSPQNILVTLDGVVKIVDFGLARATIESGRSPQAGCVGGKPSFMSPEQADGRPIDRRSDVFSLGIVLYRLITGRHPFEGETSAERLQKMRDQGAPLTAPCVLRPNCPIALSNLVLRALERDPARRFATAAALARALERAVPEIVKRACRDELAALADETVGESARERRTRIADAIAIADQRWAQDEEPVSLPSSVLQEIAHREPIQTNRPVAFIPFAKKPYSRRITAMAIGAFAVGVAGAAWLAPRLGETGHAMGTRAIMTPASRTRAISPARHANQHTAVLRPLSISDLPLISDTPRTTADAAAPVANAEPVEQNGADAGVGDWRFQPGF